MTEPEKLLRELIALPSVNPNFLPEGDPRAGEGRVVEFLAAQAAHSGLEVEREPVLPGRSNLFIRLLPRQPARQRVVLAPHSDTVGEPNMAEALFQPRARKGRLYGRGACDTKGSVAAMWSALRNVAHASRRPARTEIVLALLVDEEYQQAGSRALVRNGFQADLAIVGEPTRLRVVTAHKGVAWLTLETRGRAAHGARPELGRNAIHAMAQVVDLLETRYAAQLRERRHPVLGRPTVNVGFIQGGQQANIVPDRCMIRVDRRLIPGETRATALGEIRALLRQQGRQARVRPSNEERPCLPMETDPTLPLLKGLFTLVRQTKLAGVDFFSDASVLSHSGIPAVLFGPGDIAQAHTQDEWIALASLERGTAILTAFLRSLP
jgi:acetylornithine deacetylase/succinyl-diaminopimelate desuccinylase-like protein